MAACRRLMAHGEVIDIANADAGTIQATTASLTCTRRHDETLFDVGRFWIDFDFTTGDTTFHAIDRKHPRDFRHPHVGRDGRPCFGNAGEPISDTISKFDPATAIGLCVAFIKNANDDDSWGVRVAEWLKIREDDDTPVDLPVPECEPLPGD